MKMIAIALALLCIAIPASAARLAWNAGVGGGTVAGYNVYYKDLAVPATEYHKALPATPTEWNVTTEARLMPGKTYQFAVTAFNAAGESGRSNTVDYLVPAYAPPGDVLPPVIIVIPGAATTIRIDP